MADQQPYMTGLQGKITNEHGGVFDVEFNGVVRLDSVDLTGHGQRALLTAFAEEDSGRVFTVFPLSNRNSWERRAKSAHRRVRNAEKKAAAANKENAALRAEIRKTRAENLILRNLLEKNGYRQWETRYQQAAEALNLIKDIVMSTRLDAIVVGPPTTIEPETHD